MKADKQTELKNGHFQTNQSLSKGDGNVSEGHPLAGVIGGFAEDPLWDEFLAQVAEGRRETAKMEEALE